MQKSSLIAQIQNERQNLENTLAKLFPRQLKSQGAVGDWSVKDTLAHIAIWQQRLTDWLLTYSDGTDPQPPPPFGLEAGPLDQLNNQIYLDHRDKTLIEVLNFFRLTYQQSLEAIKGAPEEFLTQAVTFQGQTNLQVWEIVAANTFEHIQEHNNDILTWLNSTGNFSML